MITCLSQRVSLHCLPTKTFQKMQGHYIIPVVKDESPLDITIINLNVYE